MPKAKASKKLARYNGQERGRAKNSFKAKIRANQVTTTNAVCTKKREKYKNRGEVKTRIEINIARFLPIDFKKVKGSKAKITPKAAGIARVAAGGRLARPLIAQKRHKAAGLVV